MGQKSRWALPQTVHPDGYRTFTICVPDERFYIAAFEGLLIELTYSKNWQRDGSHTAAEVSRVWQQVLATAVCEPECTVLVDEMGYDMSICEQLRFHNGKLQGLCCGEWVDITGQPPQGADGPDQPGSGGTVPATGECTTYGGKLNASGQWLLPAAVNTGDTLSFSGLQGAGSDGTLHWYCPDGQIFFANACVGSLSFDGGDPAPALHHMALIVKIGAVYYDVTAGLITVPSGIVNEQVTLQVNDGSLAGNSGDYKFSVEYCNNQAAPTFTHVFELSTGLHGWTIRTPTGASGPSGLWTAGLGVVTTDYTAADGVTHVRALDLLAPVVAAYTANSGSILFDYTLGTFDNPSGVYAYTMDMGPSAPIHVLGSAAVNHSNFLDAWSQVIAGITQPEIELRSSSTTGSVNGSATLKRITVSGLGPDPYAGL
jgi:hypothetical protein